MYNQAILEAIFKAELPRPLKLTFLYFAKYGRADGSEIWPGNEVAARHLCCTELTIKRDIKRLVEGGWIVPDGKMGYTNRYKVSLSKLELPEVTLGKPKIRGKPRLEPAPPAPDMPSINGNGNGHNQVDAELAKAREKYDWWKERYNQIRQTGGKNLDMAENNMNHWGNEIIRLLGEQKGVKV